MDKRGRILGQTNVVIYFEKKHDIPGDSSNKKIIDLFSRVDKRTFWLDRHGLWTNKYSFIFEKSDIGSPILHTSNIYGLGAALGRYHHYTFRPTLIAKFLNMKTRQRHISTVCVFKKE